MNSAGYFHLKLPFFPEQHSTGCLICLVCKGFEHVILTQRLIVFFLAVWQPQAYRSLFSDTLSYSPDQQHLAFSLPFCRQPLTQDGFSAESHFSAGCSPFQSQFFGQHNFSQGVSSSTYSTPSSAYTTNHMHAFKHSSNGLQGMHLQHASIMPHSSNSVHRHVYTNAHHLATCGFATTTTGSEVNVSPIASNIAKVATDTFTSMLSSSPGSQSSTSLSHNIQVSNVAQDSPSVTQHFHRHSVFDRQRGLVGSRRVSQKAKDAYEELQHRDMSVDEEIATQNHLLDIMLGQDTIREVQACMEQVYSSIDTHPVGMPPFDHQHAQSFCARALSDTTAQR